MITIKAAVVILASLATLGTALPSTLQGQQPDALEKGSAYGNHPREVKHDDDTVFHHTHTDDDAGSTHTHEARATKTLGIYECMNEDFVMPCIWTPLKDGECYNR